MKLCSQCRYFYHGHKNEPSLCTNKKSKKFPNKISKNGHDHVCALFRPPKYNHSIDIPKGKKKDGSHDHPDSILERYKGKLKFIENLRNAYAGKEIWVLATGPSLDDIPNDFLEDKISITVKEAGIVFPNSTYNLWAFRDYGLRHIYLPRKKVPNIFGRFIFSIRKGDIINFYEPHDFLKSFYMKFIKKAVIGNMQGVCENIVAGSCSVYCGVETIAHLAIEAAIVMGASKISLIGCDHARINGKIRAQDRGISESYNWIDRGGDSGYECMAVGTDFLADFFRDYGIEIVRYYHGKGYEPVGKAKEEIENESKIM